MITGNGLIAKEFESYSKDNDIIIFASGVSNSKETNEEAFLREQELLEKNLNQYSKKKFIYFSTCSMYDNYFKHSLYTKHKINMENLIQKNSNKYIIFRLPQVIGNNNKYQLMGFLYDCIKHNKTFELYNIERNIIDIQDVKLIVDIIFKENLFSNSIINIANLYNIKVIELVKKIEKYLNKKGKYTIKSLEGKFNIEIEEIKPILEKLSLFNENNYIDNVIKKYYE